MSKENKIILPVLFCLLVVAGISAWQHHAEYSRSTVIVPASKVVSTSWNNQVTFVKAEVGGIPCVAALRNDSNSNNSISISCISPLPEKDLQTAVK